MRVPLRARVWPLIAAWAGALLLTGAVLAAAVLLRPTEGAGAGECPPRRIPGRFRFSADRKGEARLKSPTRRVPADIETWREPAGPAEQARDAEVERGAPRRATHTVAFRETLSTIARGYHGSESGWGAIAEANAIEAPYVLQIDQRLRLPNVSVASTRARIRLVPPCEHATDSVTRALAAFPANPPPEDAFQPAEAELALEGRVSEAFGWGVVVEAIVLYAMVGVLAAVWATATLGRKANVRAMGRALLGAVGVGSATGFAFVGVASLAGGLLAYGAVAQCAFAVVASASCAGASYVGALYVGERSPTADTVARGYAYASGALLVMMLYLAIAFGAFARSAAMIRLPL